MNKLRKKKLTERAYAYSRPRRDTVGQISDMAEGYEAGYRAAMADMRKVVSTTHGMWEQCHAMNIFLRPLR